MLTVMAVSSRLQEEHVRLQLKDHLLSIVKLQEEKAELVCKIADVRAQIREAHNKQQRVSAAIGVHGNQPIDLTPVGDGELTRQFRVRCGRGCHARVVQVAAI